MLQGYTMAMVPCGNLTPKKLPTGGGEWPAFRTARAQRTVRPLLPPLRKHRRFRDFLGLLFFVVVHAGLGVRDALVEGKRDSFMSVIVHSVHNNTVPHIAPPRGSF